MDLDKTPDLVYDLSQDIQLEPGQVVARMYQKATRVCEHFAIRPTPVFHPCVEDTMMESFTLDHMPSGLRVLSSNFGARSFEECEAFASMLVTAPVDWSQPKPNLSSAVEDYIHHARTEAEALRRTTWDEFQKTK